MEEQVACVASRFQLESLKIRPFLHDPESHLDFEITSNQKNQSLTQFAVSIASSFGNLA